MGTWEVGIPLLLLNKLKSQDQDTLIEQSGSLMGEVNCITNNHLPSASVYAEIGDGKQVIY